jgi:hypothetical protein
MTAAGRPRYTSRPSTTATIWPFQGAEGRLQTVMSYVYATTIVNGGGG